MGIISWVVMGLVVGFAASALSKTRSARKLNLILVSLAGAVLGGMDVAFVYRLPQAVYTIHWISLLVAFVGALLALALFRLLSPQKSPAV